MQRSEAGDALGTVENSPQPARCHLLADVGSLSAFNVAWHIIPCSHRVADWLQTPQTSFGAATISPPWLGTPTKPCKNMSPSTANGSGVAEPSGDPTHTNLW